MGANSLEVGGGLKRRAGPMWPTDATRRPMQSEKGRYGEEEVKRRETC